MMLVAALALDAALGEPRWLWSRAPHPAVLMGHAISWIEKRLNRPPRKILGILCLTLLVTVSGALGLLISALPLGAVWATLLATILLAQRSLVDHVSDVANALRGSLPAGRKSVARIVGRDTSDMPSDAVARAAIESAAENLSDGVIAPAFWFLVAGLPGMLIYKLVNTADSMIGYRTPRYEAFGWAAARLDDLLNWVPARLTALLIAAAMARPDIWPVIRRDAGLHHSPNAGWPEAAMAASLGVALSGPRSYEGRLQEYPFVFPEGRRTLDASDIERCVAVMWRAWALLLTLGLAAALVF